MDLVIETDNLSKSFRAISDLQQRHIFYIPPTQATSREQSFSLIESALSSASGGASSNAKNPFLFPLENGDFVFLLELQLPIGKNFYFVTKSFSRRRQLQGFCIRDIRPDLIDLTL